MTKKETKELSKTKYQVMRGFCYSEELGTRTKGQVIELSGDELKFAKVKECVVELEE